MKVEILYHIINNSLQDILTMDCSNVPRKSSYPMISVDEAIAIVMRNTIPLQEELVDVSDSCDRILASTIKAKEPFPTFRASIMDGYAILAPIKPGTTCIVTDKVLAGDREESDHTAFTEGQIAYITTGARVPDGVSKIYPSFLASSLS